MTLFNVHPILFYLTFLFGFCLFTLKWTVNANDLQTSLLNPTEYSKSLHRQTQTSDSHWDSDFEFESESQSFASSLSSQQLQSKKQNPWLEVIHHQWTLELNDCFDYHDCITTPTTPICDNSTHICTSCQSNS